MRILKTIIPGRPGSKKWVEKYSDDLVCVRYRDDRENHRRVTTVELIVESKSVTLEPKRIPANKILPVEVRYNEKSLRILVKKAGGKWNGLKKVWELPYHEICSLGLTKRIVRDMSIYGNVKSENG